MEFHLKYRPKTLDQVIGHKEEVKSIKHLLESNKFPHTVLFCAPPGCGKTSLARIIADNLGCLKQNILEVDGSTFTGIDDMRDIKEFLKYQAFGKSPLKVVIIDEIQGLSKKAWDSMLKITEEPPSFVYFIFCTTEESKVPKSIKTRAHTFSLQPISQNEIFYLLQVINELENLKLSDDILLSIADFSEGSVRSALVDLSKCSYATTVEEVNQILSGVNSEASGTVIQLCRLLASQNSSWESIKKEVSLLETSNVESIRIAILAYFTSCILNSAPNNVPYFAKVLEAFSTPYYQNTGKSQLVLSLLKVFFT